MTRTVTVRPDPVTVSGTATGGTDYTGFSSANLTPDGGDSGSNLTFTITDDMYDDDAETIIVTLTDGANWDLGANPSTTITITDNDAPPEVTLSASPATVAEFAGATPITVTGTMQGTTRFEENTTLTVGIAGSGAANVVDFTAPSSVTLTINANAASGTANFTLTPTDDADIESNEVITLSATRAGAVINSGSIALTDDDSATSLSLTLSATAGDVTEGASGAAGYKDVTITLGSALTGSQTVTVPLVVSGVTVTTDYTFALQPASQTGVTLLTSGSGNSAQNPAVRLSAGATSATLRFTPVDNNDRTNPAVVIAYGTGSRLPSATGVSLGTPAGSPIIFAITDDETGAINVPNNWALKPSGLGPGQPFRLLYVMCRTDQDGTSTNIRDYNTYAWQAHLEHGHASLHPYAGLLRIVGSTAAVDARVNTGMWSGGAYADGSTAQGSSGVLVYWMGGNDKVANNYFDFYDGQWVGNTDANQTAYDRCHTGNGRGGNAFIFTGSNADGTGRDGYELGASQVQYAALSPLGSGRTPLNRGTSTNAATERRNFYVLSPVFIATGETQFAQAAQSAEEDAGTVNVTVNLSPAAGGPIAVSYTLSGTATRGTDYAITGVTGNSGTVTIPAGATSVNIPVAITDDSIAEQPETIILTLTAGDGYTLGTTTTHTLTIAINDQTQGVTANDDGSYTVPNDWALIPDGLRLVGQKFRLMFKTSTTRDATSSDIAVYDGFVQGRAAAGHSAIRPYSGEFKVVGSTNAVALRDHLGMRSGGSWIAGVPIHWLNGDEVAEDYQDFCTRDSTHDTNPRERWWKNDDLADQRNESGAAHASDNFPWTGSDNDCTKHSSQYLGASGQVARGGHADGRVWGPLNTDTQAASSSNTFYAMSPVFVVGGDALTASFEASAQGANEDAGTVGVAVILNQAQAEAVTVGYTLTGTATRGTDYDITGLTGNSGAIVVPRGQTGAFIRVVITNDAVEEVAETIILTLTAGTGYTLGTPSAHTLTIGASDQPGVPPAVGLTSQNYRVDEDAGSVRLTLAVLPATENPAPATPFVVEYTIAGGGLGPSFGSHPDATRGVDLPAVGSVSVPAGALWVNFDVPITNDNLAEGAESAVITLETRTAYRLMAHTEAQITIDDDDVRGLVFDPDPMTVREGGQADYTAKLSSQPTGTVTVTISGNGLTVDTDPDTAGNQNTLTFTGGTNGTWNTPQAVRVMAGEDDRDTKDNVVSLLHATSGGDYMAADSANLKVTVTDNDRLAVTITESGGSTQVNEAKPGNTDTYTIVLSKQPSRTVLVTARSSDTSIAMVSRFGNTFLTERTFVFTTGTWNRPQEVTVRASDDDFDNPNDRRSTTITHRISTSDAEYRRVTVDPVTVNVTDDDPEPRLTLEASTTRVAEGETTTITAELASALTRSVTIPLEIVRHTAEAGDVSVPSSIRINARSMTGTATLRANQDDDADHEHFTVRVRRLPSGVKDGGASVSIIIEDDEYVAPPATFKCDTTAGRCEPSPISIGEGKTRNFYLTAVQQPTHAVTALVSVTKGAADASSVWSTVPFSRSLYSNKLLSITGLEDNATRALDPVEVTLRFVSTDPFYNGKEMTLDFQIVDNDSPVELSLAQDRETLTEGASGAVRLTVTASRPLPVPVTPVINLRTVTIGADFSDKDVECDGCLNADGSRITFPVMKTGATISQVMLHAKDDNLVERDALIRGRLEVFNEAGTAVYEPPPLISADADHLGMVLTHTDDDQLSARAHNNAFRGNYLYLSKKTEFPITVHLLGTDPGLNRMDTYPAEDQTTANEAEEKELERKLRRGNYIPLGDDLNLYRAIVLELPEGFPLTGDWITLGDGIEVVDLRAEVPTVTARPIVANSPPDDLEVDILYLNGGAPAADRINILIITEITETGITLRWSAADGADGYEVRWQTAGQSQPQTHRLTGTSYTIGGLTAGTTYQLRVMVVKQSSVVAAKSSQTITVTTDGSAQQTPQTPTEPVISVTAGAGVTEGGNAVFTVTANPAPTAPLTVSVTVSQSGDFAAAGTTGVKTVTIPTGGSVQRTVSTVNDSAEEANGSVTLTLNAGTGYTVSSNNGAATVAVADNDGTPQISVTGGNGITEGGSASFTITASPAPKAPLAVSVTVIQSGDYGVSTGSRTVTIPAGGSVSHAVATLDDAADEADGSVTVTVNAAAGYTVSSTRAAATVSVADNDAPPRRSCVTADAALLAQVLAKTGDPWNGARPDLVETFTRAYRTMLGTDAYTVAALKARPDRQTPNWQGAGPNALWQEVYAELDRLEACRATPDTPDTPESDPEISVTAGSGVTEGGSASFTVTASPAPSAPLTVTLTVTQQGDYGVSTGVKTVTIPTTGSKSYAVATAGDSADEADGSVTVTLKAGQGYSVSSTRGAATVAVSDDDDPPPATPEISVSAGSGITEGGSASFTITASPAPASPLTVTLAVTQQGDYGVSTGTKTVTVPASGSKAYTVATAGDSADEADGSVTVTLQAGSGYTVSSQGTATVVVSDDDDPAPATPQLSVTAGSGITEGVTARFVLKASPALASPLTVTVTVTQQGDYGVSTGAKTVTIPVSGSKAYTVATAGDSADEASGSVTLTLNAGQGYTVSSTRGEASVSVSDDDATTVTLAADAQDAIAEDGGVREITLTLGRALAAGERLTVPLEVSGATAGDHYTLALKEGAGLNAHVTLLEEDPHSAQRPAVVFAPGAEEARLLLTARPNDDAVERSVRVAFGSGRRAPSGLGLAGGVRVAGEALEVAIANDDAPAARPTVSVEPASASEGADELVFRVTLSEASSETVTVSWYTASNTDRDKTAARAGADYEYWRGTITIAAGQTSGSGRIWLLQDNLEEGPEAFDVWLAPNVRGADIAVQRAVMTIIDDD